MFKSFHDSGIISKSVRMFISGHEHIAVTKWS